MIEIRAIGRKSRCLHLEHLITFLCISFYSDNKGCAQRFIEFTDENLKPKVQIEDEFIYIKN